jgi:TolA-binding protein
VTDRLLTSSDDTLELALLGSALEELPTGVGLRDTALALGLTTATATALAASLPTAAAPLASSASLGAGSLGAVTAAAPPTAVASVATTTGAASLATLGKAVVGTAMVSFALLAGVEHLASTSATKRAEPLVAHGAAASPPAAERSRRGAHGAPMEQASPLAVAPPPPSATAQPSLRRSVPRGGSGAVTTPAVPAGTGQAAFAEEAPRPAKAGVDASLAEETRLLEQARAALDRGDPGGAGARLSEYRSRRPSGVLAQEAGLLEVRLLLATGHRVAAAARARELISRYPQSTHAQALRRLVAEQP